MSKIIEKEAEIAASIDKKSLRERAVVLSETIDDPGVLEEVNTILKQAGCIPLESIDGYTLGDFAKYLVHKAVCSSCKGLDCPVSGQVVRIMSINGKHSFSTVYCSRYFELSKGIQKKTDAKKQRSKTEVLFDKRKGIIKTDTPGKSRRKQGYLW